MNATCPVPQKLRELTLGQLDEQQSDELLFHVESCDDCQTTLVEIDAREDTLVESLKSVANVNGELVGAFQDEPECQLAAARALGALASANSKETSGKETLPRTVGEYELIRLLGRGGMGRVYLGRHTKLGRPVAVKFLANHRRWDEQMRQRFESEMRTIGGLSHPNIVVAHDAREIDGEAVLVTEFIDGLDLSQAVERLGRFEPQIACEIASKIVSALRYIDSQGLVHRDIKPSNTMLSKSGEVKILDLGLARLQANHANDSAFTETGQMLGTADYIAPEQINDGKSVDIRADIYGLGCTLYKLLTGNAPFDDAEHDSTYAKLDAHINESPRPIADRVPTTMAIPKALDRLVMQMLHKQREQRPSLDQIGKTLGQFATGESLAPFAQSTLELKGQTDKCPVAIPRLQTATRTAPPNRIGWISAVVLAGVVGLLLGIWLGITITIKKPDGTITEVEIPNGSKAVVDANGDVTVELTAGEKSTPHGKRQTSNSHPVSRQDLWVFSNQTSTESAPIIQSRVASSALEGFKKGDVVDLVIEMPLDNRIHSQITAVGVTLEEIRQGIGTHSEFSFKPSKNSVYNMLSPTRLVKHDPIIWKEFYSRLFQGCWRVKTIDIAGNMASIDKDYITIFHRGSVTSFGISNSVQSNFTVHQRRLVLSSPPFGANLAGNPSFQFRTNDELEIKYTDNNGEMTFALERIKNATTPLEEAALAVFNESNTPDVRIEFRIAKEQPDDNRWDRFQVGNSEERVWVSPITLASNKDLVSVGETRKGGKTNISLRFSATAGRILKTYTTKNRGHKLAILIDGKLLMAPEIIEAVGQDAAINGDFSEQETQRLLKGLLPKIRPSRPAKTETTDPR